MGRTDVFPNSFADTDQRCRHASGRLVDALCISSKIMIKTPATFKWFGKAHDCVRDRTRPSPEERCLDLSKSFAPHLTSFFNDMLSSGPTQTHPSPKRRDGCQLRSKAEDFVRSNRIRNQPVFLRRDFGYRFALAICLRKIPVQQPEKPAFLAMGINGILRRSNIRSPYHSRRVGDSKRQTHQSYSDHG